jgi:hypothetical protein
MIRNILFATLALAGVAAFGGDDLHRINGAVHVADGARAGDVATVNGSVTIGKGATSGDAATVNGSITLGEDASATALQAVNGGVALEARARVSGSVETVNGRLQVGRGAEVRGNLRNVNGRIQLDGAHVGGELRTVSGDIEIGAGSRLDGDLVVEKPSSRMHLGKSGPPRVVIGADAVVSGKLRFEREVRLFVSDRARIGAIEGATPVRFSGASAPP